MLPPLSVLAGLGADWTRRRGWTALLAAMLAVSTATALVHVSTDLVGPTDWTGDYATLRRTIPARLNPPLARLDAELPPGAKVLLVGQASVFHLRHEIVYNTVFDRETIEILSQGRTPSALRRALSDRGITHVYVDWSEIERHRKPGGYGFSPAVTPTLLARLVASGVLGPPKALGTMQELYRVRDRDGPGP